MPRVVNEEEFAVRKNEILDAAQRLVFTKGYEMMSIQDILDEMGISKGAFYHYFQSKPALMEALALRIEEEAFRFLGPILEESGLSALEKLERFFATTARWKTGQRAYLTAFLRVWYDDTNAVMRLRIADRGFRRLMPLIGDAVRQGVREGVMQTEYTDSIGQVLISLFLGLGDATAKQLLSLNPDSGPEERNQSFNRMVDAVTAYTNAIERVLGVAPGKMKFFDLDILKEWVSPLDEVIPAPAPI